MRYRGLISEKLRLQILAICVVVPILFLINDITFLNLTPDGLICHLSGFDLFAKIRYGFSLVLAAFPGVAMIIFNFSIITVLVRRAITWNRRQNSGRRETDTVLSYF